MSELETLERIRNCLKYISAPSHYDEMKLAELGGLCDRLQAEVEQDYVPRQDVPTNPKAALTGVTDIAEAARNMMECASFNEQQRRPLTNGDLFDALGTMVTIAGLNYMRLPVDADGVPCKVGDMLDWDGGRHEVMAVDGDCVWFDTDEHELKLTPYEASGCRHCDPDGWYKCPECGCVVGYDVLVDGSWSIMMDDYQIPFNNCPNCGRPVKR